MPLECPDCRAVYSKEDLFCGECGLRLSPETSGEPAKIKVESTPAELDTLDDPRRDLFEPAQITAEPKKANLLPIVIAAWVALLLLCLGATAAIVWFFIREEPAVPPPTPVVVQKELAATPPAATQMPEPDILLYQETFDGLSIGWSVFGDEDAIVGYADGEYHIAIYQTNYVTWGNPEPALDLGDMVIEVDVRQVEGPLDSNFGILLRYLEDDDQASYYWFQISGAGYFSVDLRQDNEWITLEGWEASDAIETSLRATNHMRIECSGGQFSFYNNNVHLIDIVDETIERGNIGLAAGTFDESGVVIVFDNLRIYELGE